MDKKETGIVIAGATVGTAVPFLMREYIDDKWSVEQLGNWGKPSVLTGIITGGLATALGAFFGGKIRSEDLRTFLVSYGVPALVEGILFGIFPKQTTTAPARARAVVTTTPMRVSSTTKTSASAAQPTIMISE